ncbi:MAG: type II secretion system F family protein [Lacipirellulaceae bacterium]
MRDPSPTAPGSEADSPRSAGGPQASAKTLAEFCKRLAVSLEAGIDLRKTLRSEVERSTGRTRAVVESLSNDVAQGESFTAAVARQGGWFPPLAIEMIRVGELTGTLPEVLARLTRHYDHRLSVARRLRGLVTWPLLQGGLALGVVGVLILIGGALKGLDGEPIDFLGFGLTGSGGFATYVGLLCGAAAVAWGGWLWLRARPAVAAKIAESASRLPVVGQPLAKIALARIAWALGLTLNVDLDLRRVAPLVLNASGNARYSRHAGSVAKIVGSGTPLSEALATTGEFPREFLDTLEIGEQTGKLAESTARLSQRYEQEAEDAFNALALAAAGLVWLLVVLLVVALIVRLAGFYTGVIEDLSGAS